MKRLGLRHLIGMYLIEIDRDDEVISPVAPTRTLNFNDRLIFTGIVESVVELQKIPGLQPATDQLFKLDSPRFTRCLLEAVISKTNPMLGKTIRDGRFRSVYNAVVVAVARHGKRVQMKIGDIILQAGDTLLLEAHPSFSEQQRNRTDFYLVSAIEGSAPPRYERAWIAITILVVMVLTWSLGWLSPLKAVLLASAAMLVTRCISTRHVYPSINLQVLLVLSAAIGVGNALSSTGAAEMIAHTIIGMAGTNPYVCLTVLFTLTMLFSSVISSAASALLIFPIAISIAQSLGVNFLPYVISIMVAASCGFITPIAYQTNLIIYGPGGYRFGDFARLGVPLSLIVGGITVFLAPRVWPF